jgi:hypothetical protein
MTENSLRFVDLRRLPLSLRKTNLARVRARRVDGIHVAPFEQGGIGPDLFRHACKLGLEGLVSKHRDSTYRGGRFDGWIKVKKRSIRRSAGGSIHSHEQHRLDLGRYDKQVGDKRLEGLCQRGGRGNLGCRKRSRRRGVRVRGSGVAPQDMPITPTCRAAGDRGHATARRCTWKAAVGCSDVVDWNDAEGPSVLVHNMDGAIASGEFRSCLAKRARQPDGLYLRCYLVSQIVHAVI